MTQKLRAFATDLFKKIQDNYCAEIEKVDGSAAFITDHWSRSEEPAHTHSSNSATSPHAGGGRSRVLKEGAVFEQAGINFSEVEGMLPSEMTEKLLGVKEPLPFYATGVSLVIHPRSPLIPTTHANVRYLEVGERAWFGGGGDLTPYYLFEEDAVHFHTVLKDACDRSGKDLYPKYKKWCDEYFYLPHRKEHRGIGGVFFDYVGRENVEELALGERVVKSVGESLSRAYIPIVERRKNLRWTEAQRNFQLVRRGRYVEFNLIYDRGTLFGLKTGGRTESILMSLPPLVRWDYGFVPAPGSEEERILTILSKPRDWLS